ncbi:DEAD/DEAH box helicase [Haloflavibacter putidus]|uniref:DNA 3'-5' helicase n=1 Tax=Haloflavibacter putidus TaxID=2576776 RepID=A0A507ZMP2_9FLAO|nr:DEAD/DEAH box helicase [Haloflavibacter putidus]TQD38986.1 ATP-dependent DNA helicase RecQ [Haloflavibacter putidus]
MLTYQKNVLALENPSFDAIRQLAVAELAEFNSAETDEFYIGLNRGLALLDTHQHLCQYLRSFGNMHKAKLLDAFKNIPNEAFETPFHIIDWGCGQALGTINLFDFLKESNNLKNISSVTLVEPSKMALSRAELHVKTYLDQSIPIKTHNQFFENINADDIETENNYPVIHIFSNILDVAQIDLKHLTYIIDGSIVSNNYLVAVGPLNPNNKRIDSFFRYFNLDLLQELYAEENYQFGNNWTYKAKIYKLEANVEGHLIPIEYYPTVQFAAAYELDCIRNSRRKSKEQYNNQLSHFEVAAPFDLGASVYEDVEPILAVLNNIITRGLPTRSSLFIEEAFQNAFGNTIKEIKYGEISFNPINEYDFEELNSIFKSYLDKNDWKNQTLLEELQVLLSPLAIARFQKVLVEALITDHLSLEVKEWNILVEEKDVPFATLAIKDFQQLFESLSSLSLKYDKLKLPKINLTIIGDRLFQDSKLHLNQKVYTGINSKISSITFDLVVTQSTLTTVNESIEAFSEFKCRNNCYFNIKTIQKLRESRNIYTSSLIKYKDVVFKDNHGNYQTAIENERHLTYFLQLLFRKESFRSGQLPILDRALKNLPVIGLLPTGGGKSLTYQIAALLQPGVTLIIDPLKSLMKDQYDGLINAGIDCAAYINSSLSSEEKEAAELQLESSELLFIFLSPERLAIASFRERLKHMHDYNVYFSYAVIDEVHCVSEWGHDFRFSYLHLGRNLYNYVRAKENEISLFGLTATASFDVLADVERELSGNGAFTLDSEVIVRYENTNRLELQYKIERIPISFEEDDTFDKKKLLPENLPRAVKINSSKWKIYDAKSEFLEEYLQRVPDFINELQEPQNIEYIKESFVERQNNEEGSDLDLKVEMPTDYFETNEVFKQAGIVFCPHVNNSGISVNKNTSKLREELIPQVASFSGQDDDALATESLELFRDNKSPLMVATKAFGMGIDKPNVRFTINLNYSSSLESFVQEAGRSGRDRKMALATIFVTDYEIAQFTNLEKKGFPLGLLRDKWFYKDDLIQILEEYNIDYTEDDIFVASPQSDVVKLFCPRNNKMFAFRECNEDCPVFNKCTLKYASDEARRWQSKNELIAKLSEENIEISERNFRYLNADYDTTLYFFDQSFKGDYVEKMYMHRLLNKENVVVAHKKNEEKSEGFLTPLVNALPGDAVTIYVPYTEKEYADLAKAIYRMCCIGLIEDFTQNFVIKQFRIIAKRMKPGGYLEGLKIFLLRYYTMNRAEQEVLKAKTHKLKVDDLNPITEEIYKCLWYLTSFIYDKISVKRKRAIDDMRTFCVEGLSKETNWIKSNERLKDFIYYYFNSKYAKEDYVADNGEEFSLVKDTNGGKESSIQILKKYLRVIDDDIVGVGTPLDNVKHLNGAVRLISRSLTDSNPSLSLLESFCLIYLGIKKNKTIESRFITSYVNGMKGFMKRSESSKSFWYLFDEFNEYIKLYMSKDDYNTLRQETKVIIHAQQLEIITNKYIQ